LYAPAITKPFIPIPLFLCSFDFLLLFLALINHAIDDGDRTWELDWLQNRMRYIESAENLTYDVPGNRPILRYSLSYLPTFLVDSGFKHENFSILKLFSLSLSFSFDI
jgi:hypothetical protein